MIFRLQMGSDGQGLSMAWLFKRSPATFNALSLAPERLLFVLRGIRGGKLFYGGSVLFLPQGNPGFLL